MSNLAQQAQAIADTYLKSLPPDYASRYSEIADPHTLTKLFNALADGNYLTTATRLAGISTDTYHRWMKRAEGEPNSAYASFAAAVKEAECEAEAAIVADVRKAARKEQFWAAGMTLLERKYPDKWGKRQDDTQAPRVVVQIGVGQGEVKVGLAFAPTEVSTVLPSPIEAKQIAPANSLETHAFALSSSPINSNYVNQLVVSEAGGAESDRGIPAGEPERGPQLGGVGAGGQHTPSIAKGRSGSPQRKKAARARVRKAQETA